MTSSRNIYHAKRRRPIRQRKDRHDMIAGIALIVASLAGFVAWAFWYMPALYS